MTPSSAGLHVLFSYPKYIHNRQLRPVVILRRMVTFTCMWAPQSSKHHEVWGSPRNVPNTVFTIEVHWTFDYLCQRSFVITKRFDQLVFFNGIYNRTVVIVFLCLYCMGVYTTEEHHRSTVETFGDNKFPL